MIEFKITDDVNNTLKHLEPNIAVKMLNKILQEICDKSFPIKKRSNRATPWWNEELMTLRRDFYKAKKALARTRRLHLNEEIDSAKERYTLARNTYV